MTAPEADPATASEDESQARLIAESRARVEADNALIAENNTLREQVRRLTAERDALRQALDEPDPVRLFAAAATEAKHQRTRWNDGPKTDADWFWLVGFLAGKALHDVRGKRLHHITACMGVLANWHRAVVARPELEVVDA